MARLLQEIKGNVVMAPALKWTRLCFEYQSRSSRKQCNLMADFTQERIDQVWEKGEPIRGKNPDLYRMDKLGNVMYKPSYGKYSKMGWNIDHSKPQSKGGTDCG